MAFAAVRVVFGMIDLGQRVALGGSTATYQKIAQETASVGLRHGLWHSPKCSSSASAIS